LVAVEHDPRRQGVEDDSKAIRKARSDINDTVARPFSCVALCGQRKIAGPHCIVSDEPPVVWIEPAFEKPPDAIDRLAIFAECLSSTFYDYPKKLARVQCGL